MIKKLIPLAALVVALIPLTTGAEPLKQGDSIPDVTLRNENNEAVQLRKLTSERPTVLIFYRGGWCPYCSRQLSGLLDIQDDLKAAGFQMVAISIDQPSKIKETPKRDELSYVLLSDVDANVSEAFGIAFQVPDELVKKYKESYNIDLEAASGQTHHKLPHPSVFVINREGVIQFAYVNEDYKVRLEPKKILAAATDAAK